MAFDFPAAPAVNDKYQPQGGPVYLWDGVAWVIDASGGATLTDYVLKAGDTMTGKLVLPTPDPTVPLEATHKRYVDAAVAAATPVGYVLKAGDTMTGALMLPAALPTAPEEATHKSYVDQAIAQEALYQGTWQVASNVPNLTPSAAILNSYSWIATTVDPAVPEIAPAGLPGIGGLSIAHTDTVIWNAGTSAYQLVRAPAAGTGVFLPLAGGIMNVGGCINWAPTSTTPGTNYASHIRLNKDVGYQMGFNAGTDGTLNYLVENTNNRHSFRVAGAEKLKIASAGVYTVNDIPFIFQPTVNGVLKTGLSGAHQNGTPACEQRWNPGGDNGSGGVWEWWRIGGGYGSNWAMKTTNDSSPGLMVNGIISGKSVLAQSSASLNQDIRYDVTDRFVQAFDALKPAMYRFNDQVWPPTFEDGTPVENPVRVTERDRFGFIADDPLLADVVETLDGGDRGIDLSQVLALAIAKIKQLETDLASVQSKMKVITDLT